MSNHNLDVLFWRDGLPEADVTMVLEIMPLVERMKNGKVVHCPTTVGTALTWWKGQPDTVNLIRRDMLDEDDYDLHGDPPSFYWHSFPIRLLQQAVVAGFDGWLFHPLGPDTVRAVTISPDETAPGWLAIVETDELADGYVGLGLPEPHEQVNVSVERITDFLALWYQARQAS